MHYALLPASPGTKSRSTPSPCRRCHSTHFGLTLELASRNPFIAWDTFVQGWCTWGGFATIDRGGEFEAAFREEAEAIPVIMKTTATETPQQSRICERRGGICKGIANSMIDQYSVPFTNDTRT